LRVLAAVQSANSVTVIKGIKTDKSRINTRDEEECGHGYIWNLNAPSLLSRLYPFDHRYALSSSVRKAQAKQKPRNLRGFLI
jgi:hypothetical protein